MIWSIWSDWKPLVHLRYTEYHYVRLGVFWDKRVLLLLAFAAGSPVKKGTGCLRPKVYVRPGTFLRAPHTQKLQNKPISLEYSMRNCARELHMRVISSIENVKLSVPPVVCGVLPRTSTFAGPTDWPYHVLVCGSVTRVNQQSRMAISYSTAQRMYV